MKNEMEDERQNELDCILSIFPEIQIEPWDPFSVRIELPVCPTTPVIAVFSKAHDSSSPTTSASRKKEKISTAPLDVESHYFFHLPSLHAYIKLPDGYPERLPPKIRLSVNTKWLSDTELNEVQAKAEILWEQAGGGVVLYSIIDFLQQSCENAFGYGEPHKILEIPDELRISLLDFDLHEIQARFDRETFICAICLEPKKGALCHEMMKCKHVFCVRCLQDFYINAIKAGELVSVRCLAPNCMKNSEKIQPETKKPQKIKTLDPNELLKIPIPQEIVARYVKLKHKAELESDKNTIYCPRKWCQGAARSTKRLKSSTQDELSGDENLDLDNMKLNDLLTAKNLLSVCAECSFAFCGRCYQGWHGDFKLCVPKESGELTAEDKASLEYLKLHTTPCPTCAAPSQKTHGCNHMICFICNTHFCYLCSSWLSPANPYKHFNDKTTECFMRLWELEGENTLNLGIEFPNARRDFEQNHDVYIDEVGIPAIVIPDAEVARANLEALGELPAPVQQDIEWEGPLVLRINHVPQAVQVDAPPAPVVERPNRRDHRQINIPRYQQRRFNREQNRGEARIQGQDFRELILREEANQRWVQVFVELALNDQEDQIDWNSDDEQDPAAWEIPVR